MHHIYVMQGKWVIIGVPSPDRDPLFLQLKDCAVVRYWGTTRGLGQLANSGPQEKTLVDPEPDGTRIRITVVDRDLPVEEKASKKWASFLEAQRKEAKAGTRA